MTVAVAAASDWRPLPPDLLTLKTPKLDANADAEAVFWEAWVEDIANGSYATHRVENYIRIKIYNQRGAEKWGDVKIPYYSEMKISIADIRARTIKPDGSIIDIKGNTIRDTTIMKEGRRNRIQAKNFAFPGLEPGAVIEYQFTEVYTEFLPTYIKLPMQLEVPAWEVQYIVKPLVHPGFPYRMRSYPFNCNPTPWEPLRNNSRQGFVRTSISNVPALTDESRMPHEDDVKAWLLLYYTEDSEDKAEKFWRSLGRKSFDSFKRDVKLSNEIKALAVEVTKDAQSPDDKVSALCAWVQQNIRNVSYNAAGMTNEERDRYWKKLYKPEYNANDTLKNKIGTPTDILILFYSLAQAAGLEPLYARSGSSEGAIFRSDLFDPYLLRNRLIAFKRGENYRFVNPSVPYLPASLVDYDEENQAALVVDPKEGGKLVLVPPSLATDTSIQRTATFKMDEQGGLEGDVVIRYFGHSGVSLKRDLDDTSEGSREETMKKRFEAQYPGAVITNMKIENANAPVGVLKIDFHLKMENYAQRTGKRMFFQADVFQFGAQPLFSAGSRKYPISFRHPFSENDTVTITIPEGFAFESPEMPGQLNLGKIGTHSVTATLANDNRSITTRRRLTWGENGANYFEAKHYAALKQAWDAIHKGDTHNLTLKVQ